MPPLGCEISVEVAAGGVGGGLTTVVVDVVWMVAEGTAEGVVVDLFEAELSLFETAVLPLPVSVLVTVFDALVLAALVLVVLGLLELVVAGFVLSAGAFEAVFGCVDVWLDCLTDVEAFAVVVVLVGLLLLLLLLD